LVWFSDFCGIAMMGMLPFLSKITIAWVRGYASPEANRAKKYIQALSQALRSRVLGRGGTKRMEGEEDRWERKDKLLAENNTIFVRTHHFFFAEKEGPALGSSFVEYRPRSNG